MCICLWGRSCFCLGVERVCSMCGVPGDVQMFCWGNGKWQGRAWDSWWFSLPSKWLTAESSCLLLNTLWTTQRFFQWQLDWRRSAVSDPDYCCLGELSGSVISALPLQFRSGHLRWRCSIMWICHFASCLPDISQTSVFRELNDFV